MRKLIFLFATALLALPALAVAGSPPSPADHAAAVKQCSSERTAMGAAPFKALYGTNANKSNAFGKCVAKLAQQNEQNRSNAAAACRSERSADPAAFAGKYGTGAKHESVGLSGPSDMGDRPRSNRVHQMEGERMQAVHARIDIDLASEPERKRRRERGWRPPRVSARLESQ
jgi:hypothetical protein